MVVFLFNIIVFQGCRSDEGLSDPIIRRLKKETWCEVKTIKLEPQNFRETYNLLDEVLPIDPPDLILITGDRVEMCAAACAAFHNNVKIAHLYAGVVNDPITTFDDINRHCITLWSDIILCENTEAANNVDDCFTKIKQSQRPTPLIGIVGITHLDDLEIDESKVPLDCLPVYYDLILYNTPTKTDAKKEHAELLKHINNDNYQILVSGNPDGDLECDICSCVDEFFIDLPRPQFLGLLKNCQRFITNSSSAIYEAPYFLKPEQIIMIGDRNRHRPKVDCKPGGSDKIVSILKEYSLNNTPKK